MPQPANPWDADPPRTPMDETDETDDRDAPLEEDLADTGRDDEDTDTIPCPKCGEQIADFSEQCPYCKEWINPAAAAAANRNALVFGTILMLVIVLVWVTIR